MDSCLGCIFRAIAIIFILAIIIVSFTVAAWALAILVPFAILLFLLKWWVAPKHKKKWKRKVTKTEDGKIVNIEINLEE
ncbi:hypothetical protein HOD29_02630 [archaeon]|jgi:predicted membrane protein|nr:hypothetical protein [archaeon]